MLALLALLISKGGALTPVGDIQLFPNTENSPSIYLIRFTLTTALPSKSYLLIGMDWYTSALSPHSCQLVNTSIPLRCTNFAAPSFTLTATTTDFAKFNGIFDTSKMVVIEIGSNLLHSTTYALELHLYNVVPNIQKKRVFVPELGDFVTLKVSTKALRTMNKLGVYSYIKKLEAKGIDPGIKL